MCKNHLTFCKVRISINNMKKTCDIKLLYDNIEVYLENSNKNNNNLYWRLMKDSFNIKLYLTKFHQYNYLMNVV